MTTRACEMETEELFDSISYQLLTGRDQGSKTKPGRDICEVQIFKIAWIGIYVLVLLSSIGL